MVAAGKSIVDVSTWRRAGVEPTGLDAKTWLINPEDDWPWLFKPVATTEGRAAGEDWAEVIASELAQQLGIPRPDARLAFFDNQRGCIVRKFMAQGWELQHGSTLLSGVVENFDPKDPDRTGHSLHNIEGVLGPFAAPSWLDLPTGLSAFGVFAGYLVFDALIANQDRHSSNWGVLRPPPGESADMLAPSFDHGSSLSFNVRNSERIERLAKDTVDQWAHKGQARQFERLRGAPRISLRDLAEDALTRAGDTCRRYWLERVAAVDPALVEDTITSTPELSDDTANFVTRLVLANRELILENP